CTSFGYRLGVLTVEVRQRHVFRIYRETLSRLRAPLPEVDAVINHGSTVEQAYRGLIAEVPGNEVHGSGF
ncbi:hypothetical protein ABLN73_01570, partial [Mycobacterium tuberculosis]